MEISQADKKKRLAALKVKKEALKNNLKHTPPVSYNFGQLKELFSTEMRL